MKKTKLTVKLEENKPKTVNGRQVLQIIDEYRIWPNWWEGYSPRNYFLLDIDNKTMTIYQSDGEWFLAKVSD